MAPRSSSTPGRLGRFGAAPHPTGRRAAWAGAVAGGLVGTLAGLAIAAPASWAAQAVEAASGGRVRLHAPLGTVWNGSASLALHDEASGRGSAALPGRIHWQLRAQGTWLQLALNADCCTPEPLRLRLAWGWRQLRVRLEPLVQPARWPAQLLSGLGAPWNTLQPEGQIALASPGFEMHWASGRLRLDGRVDLELSDLATRVSPLRPLGSYRLVLRGGEVPALDLSTVSGPLQLEGSGSWNGAQLRFRGTAQAAPGSETALSNLLNLLGRREGPRAILSLG